MNWQMYFGVACILYCLLGTQIYRNNKVVLTTRKRNRDKIEAQSKRVVEALRVDKAAKMPDPESKL